MSGCEELAVGTRVWLLGPDYRDDAYGVVIEDDAGRRCVRLDRSGDIGYPMSDEVEAVELR